LEPSWNQFHCSNHSTTTTSSKNLDSLHRLTFLIPFHAPRHDIIIIIIYRCTCIFSNKFNELIQRIIPTIINKSSKSGIYTAYICLIYRFFKTYLYSSIINNSQISAIYTLYTAFSRLIYISQFRKSKKR